jgi:death on curing protein
MSPMFLTLDEVLAIHSDQIARHGGSPGVRDVGLLQSALAQPQASFAGQLAHADLWEMAAAYLFHITSNHPFIDGNKRVGLVAAIVFIRMNDLDITATNDELHDLTLKVAQSQITKNVIADFFRAHAAT